MKSGALGRNVCSMKMHRKPPNILAVKGKEQERIPEEGSSTFVEPIGY